MIYVRNWYGGFVDLKISKVVVLLFSVCGFFFFFLPE